MGQPSLLPAPAWQAVTLAQIVPSNVPPTTTTSGVEATHVMGVAPATGPATTGAPINLTATTSAPATGPDDTTQPHTSAASQILQLLPIVVVLGAMYLLLFRGRQKEEKKRKNMVKEMKKGDRVMTIGGLVARVVSVEDDEVVLKIDESANVKATYKKSAIQQVFDTDEKPK